MIIKNKKNGTNILAFKNGTQNIRVIIKGGEEVNIPQLKDFSQVINKPDFLDNRGWFKIIEEKKEEEVEEITGLEKAQKEVKEYTSDNK